MKKMTTRRKLAIATWGPPREGNIYGKLTIDATQALSYIEHLRSTTGEKVTITHLVGKAVAEALRQAPSLNGRLRFGRYVPSEHVDIAFLVALEEGADLAKAKIADVDRKSVADIARDLRSRAEKLRAGRDSDFEKSKGLLRALPTWLIRPILWLTGFLTASLGLSIAALGLEAFPFGTCVISNIGVFGLDEGYAALTPFARVPCLVLVGVISERPAVSSGQLVIQPQLTITATIDHRFIDGAQGGTLAKVVRSIMENPWTLEGKANEGSEVGKASA